MRIQAVPRQFQRRHFPPPQAWSKFDDGFEASHGVSAAFIVADESADSLFTSC